MCRDVRFIFFVVSNIDDKYLHLMNLIGLPIRYNIECDIVFRSLPISSVTWLNLSFFSLKCIFGYNNVFKFYNVFTKNVELSCTFLYLHKVKIQWLHPEKLYHFGEKRYLLKKETHYLHFTWGGPSVFIIVSEKVLSYHVRLNEKTFL